MSDYEHMTYAELNALSAQLHDEYYALKGKIADLNRLREQRGIEEQVKRNLALMSDAGREALAKELAQTVRPVSIESDENVHPQGGGLRDFLKKLGAKLG